MNHEKRIFAAACAGSLLFGMVMLSLGTVNSFLIERLSLDALTIGSLAALLPLGILAGSLVFGPAVDRYGYKPSFVVPLVVMAAGFELIAFGSWFALLQVAFFVIGLGGGVINGSTNALVADISEGKRSARLSLLGFFFGVGALGMPGLTAALAGLVSYTTVIAGIGLVVLAVAGVFAALRFPAPKHPQGFPLRQAAALLREAPLLMLSSVLFFQSAMESMVSNWTALYIQESTRSSVEASLVALTVFAASLTVARLVLGGLLRTVRSERVVMVCYGLAVAGALMLTVQVSWLTALIAVVLLGAGLAPMFPVVFSYIGGMYPQLTGTAFGIALVIALTGNMGLNYLVGVLWHAAGIGAYPVTLAACAVLGIALFRAGLLRVPASART